MISIHTCKNCLALLSLSCFLILAGCGGGGSASNGTPPGDNGGSSSSSGASGSSGSSGISSSSGSSGSSSSSSGGNSEPDDLDNLTAETSELWDSGSRHADITVSFRSAPDSASRYAHNELQQLGFGQLSKSRIVIYQDAQKLLSDNFGDQFLELDLSALPQTVALGESSLPLSDNCTLALSHSIEIDGDIAQGWLSWVHVEAIQLTNAANTLGCENKLSNAAPALSNMNEAEFPFDIATILILNAIDSTAITDISGWEIRHEQRISKYFRVIGDSEFEVVSPNQRIAFNVFSAPASRASWLADQLSP